jgi:HPr kinase/phosphorylase
MRVHGSCVARHGAAVLVLGPAGSGKSDLVLRLVGRGWDLVADDQVLVEGRAVAPPPALAGLLEVRGLGIFEGLPVAAGARLALAVELVPPDGVVRLPVPAAWGAAAVPRVALHAFEASACDKVGWALDAALGHRAQRAGAFAA